MPTDSPAGIGFSAHLSRGVNGGAIVTVFGEIDRASSPGLREVLTEALDLETEIELDVRACPFVDSSGIAVLAWAAWQLKERGLLLRIRGARERVSRIFEVAGLAGHSSVRLESFDEPSG